MKHDKLTWCTDDQAINHLMNELDIELLDLIDPRPDHRKLVYDVLSSPDNIGDVHLKTLLRKAQKYEIKTDLL